MRLEPEQLERHLQKGLAPVYLVAGEEPLTIEECCDAIRRRAHEHGYERQAYTVDPGFDWNGFNIESHSLSLFAARRLIELRLPTAEPGDDGARALIELARDPRPDTALLVVTGRLDKATRESQWAKALEAAGVALTARELSPQRLPGWIGARLQRCGLSAGPGVIDALAYHMEGNLLACAQEIDKLALRLVGGTVTLEELRESLTDNARFDVYGLADGCLKGDAATALRRLHSLRAEDGAPTLVLWVLARELRALSPVTHALARGRPEGEALAPVWASRRALVAKAAKRLGHDTCLDLLRRAARLDRVVKGRAPGDAWHELEKLALALCGVRVASAA